MTAKPVTAKQVSAMIMRNQNSDFSPVVFTVVDYRATHTVTTIEPLRRESEVVYYRDHGYTVTVRENRGDFIPDFAQVMELTRWDAKTMTFRSYEAAAAFVRHNYHELAAARTAFYA